MPAPIHIVLSAGYEPGTAFARAGADMDQLTNHARQNAETLSAHIDRIFKTSTLSGRLDKQFGVGEVSPMTAYYRRMQQAEIVSREAGLKEMLAAYAPVTQQAASATEKLAQGLGGMGSKSLETRMAIMNLSRVLGYELGGSLQVAGHAVSAFATNSMGTLGLAAVGAAGFFSALKIQADAEARVRKEIERGQQESLERERAMLETLRAETREREAHSRFLSLLGRPHTREELLKGEIENVDLRVETLLERARRFEQRGTTYVNPYAIDPETSDVLKSHGMTGYAMAEKLTREAREREIYANNLRDERRELTDQAETVRKIQAAGAPSEERFAGWQAEQERNAEEDRKRRWDESERQDAEMERRFIEEMESEDRHQAELKKIEQDRLFANDQALYDDMQREIAARNMNNAYRPLGAFEINERLSGRPQADDRAAKAAKNAEEQTNLQKRMADGIGKIEQAFAKAALVRASDL